MHAGLELEAARDQLRSQTEAAEIDRCVRCSTVFGVCDRTCQDVGRRRRVHRADLIAVGPVQHRESERHRIRPRGGRLDATTDHLIVVVVDDCRCAPVRDVRVIVESPPARQQIVEPAEHIDPELMRRPHLLADELRRQDGDQGRGSVIDVPDSVRRQELTDAHAELLVLVPLDVRALENDRAPLHRVLAEPVRSVEDGGVDRPLRIIREANLDERAPVLRRMKIEVEVHVAEHERRVIGLDIFGMSRPQLLKSHVDEPVEPKQRLLGDFEIDGCDGCGLLGIRLEVIDLGLELCELLFDRRRGRRRCRCGFDIHGLRGC